MKRIPACILFFLALSAGVHAQNENSWFTGKPIVGFRFQGLTSVSESDLVTLLAPYKGKPFSYDTYWEMQNKLYAMELFESVAADAIEGDPEKKSVIISFQLKERPVVSRITFIGNNNVTEKDLRDAILLKEKAVWSEAKMRVDADAIKNVYMGKGFMETEVASSYKNDDNVQNRVEVTFTIIEGAKTTVKKILFSGNKFASDGTLKGLIQNKEPALFVNADYQADKLKEDMAAIENYYANNGFYYAKVEKVDKKLELNEAEKRKYMILTFYIKEGNQYTYGRTTFEGNKIFSTEKLNSFMQQKTGDIISRKKTSEDYMKIVSLYYDGGYVTTQINSRESVDEGKKEISFVITIVEGDRSHIGKIIIRGNTKTKESVIRRELPFEEGDVFSRAKIQEGYINLMRTGYFSRNIVFEPAPGSVEGVIDIVITIEESSTAHLEVGGSIIPGDFPFTAYANLSDKNFLGMGMTGGVNLNLTTTEQSLAVNYEYGWIFGERILGGINFSVKHQVVKNVPQDIMPGNPMFNGDEEFAFPDPFTSYEEYEAALNSGEGIPEQYTMKYDNVQFRLGFTGGYSFTSPLGLIGFRLEPSYSLSYVLYDATVNRPFSPTLRSELDVWNSIFRLGLTVFDNNTDVTGNPESGYFISQYIGQTGFFDFESRHYLRLSTELEGYLKLFETKVSDEYKFRIVIALHTQLSFIIPPIWGAEATVEEDLYRVDGMFVGRGWNLRQRGKMLWDNKLEIRMPLVENALWWTIFYMDVVGLWQDPKDFLPWDEANFFFSMGTGIRLVIPGVPLRLYFAKRFKIVNGAVEWQEGNLRFWEGASLDLVFSIDINPF
jgi:outer membrane protein insertion porin family